MQLAPLIDRFISTLFNLGGPADSASEVDPEFLHQAIEVIVSETQPRLRLLPDYAERLAPHVRRALAYMRSIADAFPGAFELSPTTWGSDPRANAFFATPADVARVLRDSEDLRAFFDDPANALQDEAYAMLVMEKTERRSLGVAAQGEVMRREVPRLTLSFAYHRLLTPAATLAEERRAVGLRIFRTLADIAMENILRRQSQAQDLGEEKALLATRLRQARARAASFVSFCDDGSRCPDAAALERELAELDERLRSLRASLSSLENTLAAVGEVIGDPARYLGLRHSHLWVDRMGVVLPGPGTGPINELRLTEGEATLKGRTRHYVVAIAHCRRADQPPALSLKELPAVW